MTAIVQDHKLAQTSSTAKGTWLLKEIKIVIIHLSFYRVKDLTYF
jgi:hypothetical protein